MTVPVVGTPGPVYANNINDAILRIDAAAPVSVKAYGAIGDGAANDTLAVQRAIDAAFAEGGGAVLFPAGTYSCGQLVLKHQVSLLGVGEGSAFNTPNGASVLKLRASTNLPLIRLPGDQGGALIRSLKLDGSKGAQASSGAHGLHIEAGTYGPLPVRLENVMIANCKGSGLYAERGGGRAYNSDFRSNDEQGVFLNSGDWKLVGCHMNFNTKNGIYNIGNNDFFGCESYQNTNRGAVDDVGVGSAYVNCSFDTNGREGVRTTSDGTAYKPTMILGCHFYDNSQTTHNTYGHIGIADSARDVLVDNCRFVKTANGIKPASCIHFESPYGGTAIVGQNHADASTCVLNSITNREDNLRGLGYDPLTNKVGLAAGLYFEWGSGGPQDRAGVGSPEGTVTAPIGSTY